MWVRCGHLTSIPQLATVILAWGASHNSPSTATKTRAGTLLSLLMPFTKTKRIEVCQVAGVGSVFDSVGPR